MLTHSMKGQWLGTIDGTNVGTVNLDVDELQYNFEGIAYVEMPTDQKPDIFLIINTLDKSSTFSLKIDFPAFVHEGKIITKQEAHQYYPDAALPEYIESQWRLGDREIFVDWQTNLGTNGTCHLKMNESDLPSSISAKVETTWDGFKKFVRLIEDDSLVFRGQENSTWRLRTGFHRKGRSNIYRFENEDVPLLYRNLSNLTNRGFDFNKSDEYGAFVSMVQHHGYPTPLLDWTYSPYIAAFFAFDDIAQSAENVTGFARVHAFNKRKWIKDFPQLTSFRIHRPHFSVLETISLNNPRMVPQQALATITNVADIESYIQLCERQNDTTYISVFDIPVSERKIVLRDLRLMGITAGSLFPGIDGTCRQIRSQMFGI